MKLIISSEMSEALRKIGIDAIGTDSEDNIFIIEHKLAEDADIRNLVIPDIEPYIQEKEPSWVRLNRGKISKRERRKHKS